MCNREKVSCTARETIRNIVFIPGKAEISALLSKAPVKRSKLFTQQHTTFVYHLLHVVALDSGQTHQTFCATLYNFIIFCGLSD